MTPEQQKWLDEHPNYSVVRNMPIVSLKGWTDKGWLFANGQFSLDDGKTLFPHTHPGWFPAGARVAPGVVEVGRHYDIV